MTIDSHTFNPQIYEWIFDISRYIKECKQFIFKLYEEKREFSYATFKSDFWYISRGVKIQLIAFRDRIQDNESKFFNKVTSNDKRCFLDVLNQEILELESLEDYDYSKTDLNKKALIQPQSFKERLTDLWISLKKVFYLS